MSTQKAYSKRKDMNDLHNEVLHPFDEIIRAVETAIGLQMTSTVKTCRECALAKQKRVTLNKKLLHMLL